MFRIPISDDDAQAGYTLAALIVIPDLLRALFMCVQGVSQALQNTG